MSGQEPQPGLPERYRRLGLGSCRFFFPPILLCEECIHEFDTLCH